LARLFPDTRFFNNYSELTLNSGLSPHQSHKVPFVCGLIIE
jgi:hypothetical protein